MATEEDILEGNVNDLEVKGIIGFDGGITKGLILHPDGKHLVYPLGNKVAIHEMNTKEQVFLAGHTNIISSIDVSRSGKHIASGQINHPGFKARVIVWDFDTHLVVSQHELHKVRVEAVSFSSDGAYLFSIGGRDCGYLVVWDVALSQVVCSTAAAHGIQGEATALLSMNRRGPCFMTGGDNHLAVWTVDRDARKGNSLDVNTGRLKRSILCMDTNERDEVCFCGTATGDILKVRLNYHHDLEILMPAKQPMIVGCMTRISKRKLPIGKVDLYSNGIRSIKLLFGGPILIGAGDGTIELVEETKAQLSPKLDFGIKIPSIPSLRILKSTTVFGAVTSIQMMKKETVILVGTENSEIFTIDRNTFTMHLMLTCHTSTIYDVAFPYKFSEVFATAGKSNVRIWSIETMQELLRINVQNFSCSNVVFSHDGKSILTAWNDGVIRSFTPLTGRLIYAILNAHNKGVSAIGTTHAGDMLVSGGCEGQVRLWAVSPYRQTLICTLKEHKAPVSAIDTNEDGTEAVSASTDGTCIIWDLVRQCRRHVLFGTTLFMCARYYPTGVQIITGGSDRKVSYWEVLGGCLVREIEGSQTGAINSLDINLNGTIFATGGNDQIIKLWNYQEGVTTHIGIGHASVITSVRFSPDQKYIVSASGAGNVFVWKCPFDFTKEEEPAKIEVKEEKVETKDEVIQDLPSARSDVKAEPVCPCTCPNRKNPVSKKDSGRNLKNECGDKAPATPPKCKQCPKISGKQ